VVPFDNTNGLVTSIAVVNPMGSTETISVSFQTESGTITTGKLADIPSNGHMAFVLPTQFPALAGQRGLAEFYTSSAGAYINSGGISLIALRANSSLAFTSAPVYPFSSQPIIGQTPATSFLSMTVTGAFAPLGYATTLFTLIVRPDSNNITYTGAMGYFVFTNGTTDVTQTTFTFNSVNPYSTYSVNGVNIIPSATGNSLTFTLSQTSFTGGVQEGNINGTMRIVGTDSTGNPYTIAGSVTGTYSAQFPAQ
jgi:hypothetical protein